MAWVPALKVLCGFTLVFGVMPRILFPRPGCARGPIDRFVIDLVRMAALVIATVHILVPIRLFQWTGLGIAGVAWIYLVRLRPAGWGVKRFAKIWEDTTLFGLYVFEAISRDGNEWVRERVRFWLRTQVRPKMRPRLPSARTAAALALLLPLGAVLAASLAIRIYFPLTHAALPSADSYVHLAWVKYLLVNDLFHDGIYPEGMHALLAFTGTISPAKSIDLIRFGGPIFNTLTVLVAYIVGVRATRNAGVGLLAAAGVGLSAIRPEIGVSGLRQIATLPQEFAVLFALVGALMAVEYVAHPSRSRLLYVGLSGFVVAMSHPLAGGIVAVVAGVAGAAAALRQKRPAYALRMWIVAAGGLAIGQLYLPFGKLAGRRIYGAIKHINPVETATAHTPTQLATGASAVSFRNIVVASLVVCAVFSVARAARGDRRALVGAVFSLAVLACLGAVTVGSRVFHGWYALRWEEVVLPLLPVGLAVGIAPVRALWARRRRWIRATAATAGGLALTCALVVALPPRMLIAKNSQIEYESAARVLGSTIHANERLTYTVVGPPAWYPRVLGSGYHVHLIDFADKLTVADAMDPAFEIPTGTPHTYVLTEKQPFAFGARNKIRGLLARYYDLDRRRELMGKVEAWMRIYDRFHADVRVHYEDDAIRVWYIRQAVEPEYAKRFNLAGSRSSSSMR